MILYSPAKINIGLHILRKREDGYHDLDSLMYPIPFCDIIEMQVDPGFPEKLAFTNSGIKVPGDAGTNLCEKAIELFFNETSTSSGIKLHLHKQIPFGAGLGGGSSNASTVLLGINMLNNEILTSKQLADMAAQLGSDCPVFIYGKAMMASGRGEILEETNVDLSGYYLVLLNPGIVVPTAEAYSKVVPNCNRKTLAHIISAPIYNWKDTLINDFENSIFPLYPEIQEMKLMLYKNGAIYSSMSGSGSSVYGIYEASPELPEELRKLVTWNGWL